LCDLNDLIYRTCLYEIYIYILEPWSSYDIYVWPPKCLATSGSCLFRAKLLFKAFCFVSGLVRTLC